MSHFSGHLKHFTPIFAQDVPLFGTPFTPCPSPVRKNALSAHRPLFFPLPVRKIALFAHKVEVRPRDLARKNPSQTFQRTRSRPSVSTLCVPGSLPSQNTLSPPRPRARCPIFRDTFYVQHLSVARLFCRIYRRGKKKSSRSRALLIFSNALFRMIRFRVKCSTPTAWRDVH